MGHYAKINSDNIVEQVIVAEADFIKTLSDKDSYIKTSYNTRQGKHYVPKENQDYSEESADQSKALRKNYAGIGHTYDKTRDAFISPKPFASWILNETTCTWNAPVAYPSDWDGINYKWNEDKKEWIKVD